MNLDLWTKLSWAVLAKQGTVYANTLQRCLNSIMLRECIWIYLFCEFRKIFWCLMKSGHVAGVLHPEVWCASVPLRYSRFNAEVPNTQTILIIWRCNLENIETRGTSNSKCLTYSMNILVLHGHLSTPFTSIYFSGFPGTACTPRYSTDSFVILSKN